jgi:hypothetical protein
MIQPENGAVIAMNKPGIVSTSFTKVSADGLPGKALVISGKEGAMVAPAITVIMLQNRMVTLASFWFLSINIFMVVTQSQLHAKSESSFTKVLRRD